MRLFLLTVLMAVDWGAPRRRLIDLGLGLGALAVGIWWQWPGMVWGGLAGIALAALNPMGRLRAHFAPRRRPSPQGAR